VLGFYLSAHPLSEHESASAQPHQPHHAHHAADCAEPRRGDCGWDDFIDQACPHPQPEAWEHRPSTPTSTMEDLDGTVRCICWPDGYEQMGQFIEPDAVVLIRGAVDRRDGGDECNLICNEVTPLHEADTKYTTGIRIHLDEQKAHLQDTCRPHPGDIARLSLGPVTFCSCLRSGHRRNRALTLADSIKSKSTANSGIGWTISWEANSHRLIIAPPKPNKNPFPKRASPGPRTNSGTVHKKGPTNDHFVAIWFPPNYPR
jgi:DNA polymerase III alpha subunit